ncbi:MAG TPA: tetratricopeptide repeat protein [Pyrinomonadaceae bacterium]|nr:tetratricopeptide repeat protein [Pyrinomonadaceae bacterium]
MTRRQPTQILKLALVALTLLACACLIVSRASAGGGKAVAELRPPADPPDPPGLFSPSNARTQDGRTIPADQFIPAERCASCHRDTHEGWAESVHRNAARAPFYKESVDILERTRGSEAIMHCESCHSPVAALSGALFKENNPPGKTPPPRPFEDEGVTCSVCHSVTEARTEGTGSYTIRRPALLAREDGTPVYGEVTDAQIMADVAGHKRAVMSPLLKSPEFCATCHKSNVTPPLNGYKFLRGFSVYDEWQQSGASGDTVAPYYRREKQVTCNTCHMPKHPAANDLAARRDGVVTSHRWLGANTATPLFFGQIKQVRLTEEFLKAGVLTVDIFALRSEATGRAFAPLSAAAANRVELRPGEEVTAEVVVFNRKAAHSFPPELRDMYEPWVEFEATDAAGKTIFHSGFLKPDGTLDERAHVYKAILLDETARPVTRHQVWSTRIKAYDNFVGSGRSDLARYRFRVPKEAAALSGLTLRARVNYRRFIHEYTEYVLNRRNASHLKMPVVRMAEASVKLSVREPRADGRVAGWRPDGKEEAAPSARRWNDYGIALLEQAQYGPAADAFRRASELNPADPNLVVNEAIAELKTERYGPERTQLRKAAALFERALKIAPTKVDPTHARARFYRSLLLRSEGRAREAADELAAVAREYPRDREVRRQLGQTLYGLGRLDEARRAFEAVTAIDPNDHNAHQFLATIYESGAEPLLASAARARYLLWRDDPLADVIANRFFAAHPGWAEERIPAHTHAEDSAARPTLTGPFAAEDE